MAAERVRAPLNNFSLVFCMALSWSIGISEEMLQAAWRGNFIIFTTVQIWNKLYHHIQWCHNTEKFSYRETGHIRDVTVVFYASHNKLSKCLLRLLPVMKFICLIFLPPSKKLFGITMSLGHIKSHLLKDVCMGGEIKCRLQF